MVTTPAGVAPAAYALTCRGCAGDGPRRLVDLGAQPASDDFPALTAPGPDPQWPLELWFCPTCALVQLGPVPALVAEPVRAVESDTHRRHTAAAVASVLAEHPQLAGRGVREFASHHGGSWLPALAERGCRPVATGRPAQLVVDAHALAHEEDVAGCLAVRADALAPEGLLVLEFHHLLALVEQGQFDTVRHGHWSYLSLTAVQRLAARHRLEVVGAVAEPVFGGSLRVVLGHQGAGHAVDPGVGALLGVEADAGLADGTALHPLQDRAHDSATALREYLTGRRRAGRRVLAYGAPSKAAVLLGLSGIGPELLEFTVDAAPLKHHLAIPSGSAGGRIPIRPVGELVAARPDEVLLLTWDIADEVVATLEADGGWGATYVVPLPAPHPLPARPLVAGRWA
jgi:hypothetical protein